MKEHKSNLKALEPVEIRLAAAVRIRYEIARLRAVEQSLTDDAREIAISVVGSPEIAEVVLTVVGGPFADDPESYDQTAVEAFLSESHELHLGGSAPASTPAQGETAPAPSVSAPASGGQPASGGPAANPPAESASGQQQEGEPSAADAVAERLSAYEFDLPADYFGVSFDMVKRPEANLIMGEAVLAVVDGLSLDASPYKGDRGKVHWRRKLFEETFARFQASPPRAKAAVAPEPDVQSSEAAPVVDDAPLADGADPVVEVPARIAAEAPVEQPLLVADAVISQPAVVEPAIPTAPVEQAASARDQYVSAADGETLDRTDADVDAAVAADVPLHDDVAVDEPLAASEPEPARELATSGQVIDFPSPAAPSIDPGLDLLDPFESSPPQRSVASFGSEDLLAPASADRSGHDHEGHHDGAPTYDGPEWEGPGDEAQADLDRSFEDRVGYDRGDDAMDDRSADGRDLDQAAAAALADAVSAPSVEERDVTRLPVGGVPPRPAIAMPSARPVPSVPPRPAPAAPTPVASAMPPVRPALAGAGDGVRLAPRPVAVRPPGM